MSKVLFGICVLILTIFCHDSDAATVTYYQNAGFKGDQNTIDISPGVCVNLQLFKNRVSSINTRGNCINVYIQAGCSGATARIAPGTGCHSNLGDCGMNDSVRSLRLC